MTQRLARRASRRIARPRSLAVLAVAVATTTAVALPLDAFGFGATGNPASIAFYRLAAKKTDALPAYVINQSGWMRVKDSVKQNTVSWAWGFAQFTSSDYRANERIVLVQHNGVTVWLKDTITPINPGCHVARCKQHPIEFIIRKAGAFEGIVVSGQSARCFNRQPLRKVPYTIGTPWWVALGHYYPKLVRGRLTEITSRYTNEGQVVTETDLITTKTKLFAKSLMRASRGSGHRAFNYRISDTRLAKVPALPSIRFCRVSPKTRR